MLARMLQRAYRDKKSLIASPFAFLISDWLVAAILLGASALILATAPVAGDFWWQDAPRHALNGAFVKDFVTSMPWRDPAGWAISYYQKYPALTILFYPPFFYGVEALLYSLLGVSHFAAQATVTIFITVLAAGAYQLARLLLPRCSALGVALMVIGAPEAALWGRQVMVDIPAYACAVFGSAKLAVYLRGGRPRDVYVAAAFVVAALYTKYNVAFILPALLLAVLIARGRSVLRDRHLIVAATTSVVAIMPAAYLMQRFGAANLQSVAGRSIDLPRDSLAAWLFYPTLVPHQLGYAITLLAVAGAVALVRANYNAEGWLVVLLGTWLAFGYLFFSWISVRESRHDLMVLLPLVLLAGVTLHRLLGGGQWAQGAVLVLGLATLGYSVWWDPVPVVTGSREAANYVAQYAPPRTVVLFSGYRDGNFIFNMRAHTERSDLSFVRADKLLLRVTIERERGVQQTDDDEIAIARRLRENGIGMVVAQQGFWDDLQAMQRLTNVLHSADFKPIATFPVTGTLSRNDEDGAARGKGAALVVYVPNYQVEQRQFDQVIDMPIIGERFKTPAAKP